MIELICKECGSKFYRYPSQRGKCCSKYCASLNHSKIMRKVNIIDRFFEKVWRNNFYWCWVWTGATDSNSYGNFWDGWSVVKAHCWSYRNFIGIYDETLHLDHLCNNAYCVNPYHLEPVTLMTNLLRGDRSHLGRLQRERTHCPYGHPYDEDNTWVSKTGSRHCKTCNRENMRIRRELGI